MRRRTHRGSRRRGRARRGSTFILLRLDGALVPTVPCNIPFAKTQIEAETLNGTSVELRLIS
jgi:hypothetical protein